MKQTRAISLKTFNLAIFCALLLITGCGEKAAPVEGFVLPKGDVTAGQAVFSDVGCRFCHSIADLELPPFHSPQVLDIVLGGQVFKVQSYGELLTSIVNPEHKKLAKHLKQLPEDGKALESPMPDFNDVMSVRQLIDLTEFLHSRYEKLERYRGYSYMP